MNVNVIKALSSAVPVYILLVCNSNSFKTACLWICTEMTETGYIHSLVIEKAFAALNAMESYVIIGEKDKNQKGRNCT